MRQTLALLLDSYRDLNSRRLFWITLAISTLVAAAFGAVGITPVGLTIFGYEFKAPYNLSFISAANFYKMLFVTAGLGLWLTSFATLLALFSTASIFPDFLASGAVDLYLSKPISRLRLFFTKYFGGLLFLGMQIACFCIACFLVIGLRAGVWIGGLFLAIPIVLLFYSYIFAICTAFGVWTRSTLASVLLTLLVWFTISGIHTAENVLLETKFQDQAEANLLDERIASETAALDRLRSSPAATQMVITASTPPSTRPEPFWQMLTPRPDARSSNQNREQLLQSQLDQAKAERATHTGQYDRWHEIFYVVMTALPKTAETVDLLNRELFEHAGMETLEPPRPAPRDSNRARERQRRVDAEVMLREELAKRSVGWVAGTSVGFECVVLALAAWMFCRRDY